MDTERVIVITGGIVICVIVLALCVCETTKSISAFTHGYRQVVLPGSSAAVWVK